VKTKITITLVLLILSINHILAQQTLNETIFHNGVSRQYILYIPAMYDGTSPVPLMFNFHGFGNNANIQMTIFAGNMRSIADTAGFILVFPEGSLWFGLPHWSVGSWTEGSPADDVGFTEAMIDTISDNYNIDSDRVYSSGYSNGGYFSFELACQLSERIAAIASITGTMSTETYTSCNPSHPTPVLTIHGTADNVVNYNGGNPANSKSLDDVNAYWSTYNNTADTPLVINLPDINSFDGSTVELSLYEEGDNCTSVAHYKVIGGGHDWVGSFGNMDIDASIEIWNFVSKYDMSGLIGCSTLSVQENAGKDGQLLVYPNPAVDRITIELDWTDQANYQIYSTIGELKLNGVIHSTDKTIDLTKLQSGIYILKVGTSIARLIKTS